MTPIPETVGDIIYRCHQSLPGNVDLDLAIDAHRQALKHPNATVRHQVLRVVILACMPDVDADRKLRDYLTNLSVDVWAGFPDPERDQRKMLAMVRRAVGWQAAI